LILYVGKELVAKRSRAAGPFAVADSGALSHSHKVVLDEPQIARKQIYGCLQM
jgi:hypothetical protein